MCAPGLVVADGTAVGERTDSTGAAMLGTQTCKAHAVIGAAVSRTGAQGSGCGRNFFLRPRPNVISDWGSCSQPDGLSLMPRCHLLHDVQKRAHEFGVVIAVAGGEKLCVDTQGDPFVVLAEVAAAGGEGAGRPRCNSFEGGQRPAPGQSGVLRMRSQTRSHRTSIRRQTRGIPQRAKTAPAVSQPQGHGRRDQQSPIPVDRQADH